MTRPATVGQEEEAVQAVAKLALVLAVLVLVRLAGAVVTPCSLVPVVAQGPVLRVLPVEPWRERGRRA